MRKKIYKILLVIFAAELLFAAVSAVVCSSSVKVTKYNEPITGLVDDIKIVCISDLHGKEYGENNSKLLSLISEQKPDAIFVLGDMINSDADENEVMQFLNLLEKLGSIAQVYFSPGNHEMDYMLDTGDDLMSRINTTGTFALCDEYIETEIGGSIVRVGGSLGHYYRYEWSAEEKENPPDYQMEESIGAADVPALVMLHMPESIIKDCAAKRWTGDLYFCGHTHGGVIRIPAIGGVFAPAQGLFPEYDSGSFTSYGQRLIISSGLAGYDWVPRVFNRPEICVVNLITN